MSNLEKKLWVISHVYDTDGGFGDSIPTEELLVVVKATDEEIQAFLDKYDKPYVYDTPYANLYCHGILARAVKVVDDISTIKDDWLEYELHSPDWEWVREHVGHDDNYEEPYILEVKYGMEVDEDD